MRAVRIHENGGSDQLRMDTIPVPQPGEGEALVKVDAAGVNFIDTYKREGLYKTPLPLTLGEEGAGTVVAVGSGASEVREGDRVAWAGVGGAYADFARVPTRQLVPIPRDVPTEIAAAVMLQGMTAHYLAISTFPLKQDDRCLIQAAAGGVGLLLVQIAKKRGAYVIGTAGTDEKAELARNAGADHMIVYTREDFVAETKRVSDGRGVNVVYDSVGRTTFNGSFDVLTRRGMLVLFGQSSGVVPPIDPLLLNQKGSLFLTRPKLGDYVATRDELLQRAGDLFRWIEKGELSVRIGSGFALDQVAAAHDALEGRRTTGKVIIRVTP
jgi:NADPH2:quinone reductase